MNQKYPHPLQVLAAIGFIIFSQTVAAKSAADTLDLDVTFVGDREVLLQDAHKQLHWPVAAKLTTSKPTFSYNVIPKRLNVEPEWTRNGPIRLKVNEPLSRLYKGYINAGMGNYLSPLLQVSYSDIRSRSKSWGVHFTHESTDGGFISNDSINQQFSSNHLNGWYRKFWKDEAITAASSYAREYISLYGGQRAANQDSLTSQVPDGFNYQVISNRIHLTNRMNRSAHWQHELRLDHDYLWNNDHAQEHNFDLKIGFSGLLDTTAVKLDIHANVDRLNRVKEGDRVRNERQAILDIHPGIKKSFGPIKTSIGIGLWIDAQGNQPFLFTPELEASVSLLRDLFVPYIRINGGIDQNRYQTALGVNPFVTLPITSLLDTNRIWHNTYETVHGVIGMKGSITRSFSFNINAELKRNNQHLFWAQQDALSEGRSFAPFYQDVTIASLRGDGTLTLSESTELIGQVSQHNYRFRDSITSNQEAWFLPKFELDATISHTIKGKLRLKANLLFQTGRLGLAVKAGASEEGNEAVIIEATNTSIGYSAKLDNVALLNLHAEYLYNARVSGWIRLNNILNQTNPFFTGYDNQNFRFQMGASYSF